MAVISPEVYKKYLPKKIKEVDKIQAYTRANKWVNQYGVKNRIEAFARNLDINYPRKKLTFEITAGGGSYTDSKMVRLALADDWFIRTNQEYVTMMKFLAVHEMGHINWSDFKDFVDFQHKVESYFQKKHGIDGMGRFGGDLLNITEDGRIERLQANEYPGTLILIRYINGVRYLEFPSEQLGIQPLNDFRNVMLMLAKTGLVPEGYDVRVKGTDTDKAIQKARPSIVEAIRAPSTKACADATWKIITDNEDFIVEAIKPQEIDEDLLEQLLQGDDLSGSNDSGDNADTNEGEGQESKESSGENQQEGNGQGLTITIEPLEGVDGEPDFKGESSNKPLPKGNSSTHLDGDDVNESSPSKEQADAEAAHKETTDEESSSENKAQEETTQSEEVGNKNSEDGKNPSEESSDKEVKEKIERTLEELKEEIQEDSEDFIEKAKKVTQQENDRIAREEALREDSQLSEERIDSILSKYERRLDFIYTLEQTSDNGGIPSRVEQQGRRLHEDIKELFLDKQGWSLPNQRSGRLDVRNLYRAGQGINQQDVFIKRHQPDDTNWVVSVLVDNSGSMHGSVFDESGVRMGTKSDMAREATTMLEIALNGVVPFNITRFDTGHYYGNSAVQHAQVRGFEQDTEKVLSWNATRDTGGGNADAISIAVATEELIKRQETKKLLIVLSDGLPAQTTEEQVKDAVEKAREQDVHVVGIGFGDEYELSRNADKYRMMYGQDVLLTRPDELSMELINVLERTIFI